MFERIAEGNGREDRRPEIRSAISFIRRAVLVLLLSVAAFPGPAVSAREQLVRQEAPFPPILGSSTEVEAAEAVSYEVLRGDFHMHTLHSDGVLTPADRVLEAWQYGYDVIAITDHGNFRAYEEAVATAETLGIVLLRGMETGLSGNEHLIALDFSADYQPRNPHQWADTPGQSQVYYREQWPQLAVAGGYVFYAHPHVGLREPMLWGIGQGLLQGIEVKNDVVGSEWNTVQSHGTWWYPFAFDWAVDHNLTIFANSDVHGSRAPVEQAMTLVLARDRSREGVMEALRAGRTVAYFSGMLCAHDWVLQLLMTSLVDVCLKEVADGPTYLRLQNRGPVHLTAEIEDMPVGAVNLGMYQEVLVGLRRTPDIVAVKWTSLYTSPTTNLTTLHALSGATP